MYYGEWSHKFRNNIIHLEVAGGLTNHEVWDVIRKAKVSPKVQIFNWRVMKDSIPCAGILAKRHVGDSG